MLALLGRPVEDAAVWSSNLARASRSLRISEEAQQVAPPNGSGAVVCGLGVSWLAVGAL